MLQNCAFFVEEIDIDIPIVEGRTESVEVRYLCFDGLLFPRLAYVTTYLPITTRLFTMPKLPT